MDELVPAVVFPPGEYLLEILNDRGWSQLDFAEIIGRSPKLVNEIVRAKTSISPTTAKEIAAATGTSPVLWLNLETAYRLHKDQEAPSPSIARRAKLRQLYPVREMVKRGWIKDSSNPEAVERAVMDFFSLSSIDDAPRLYAHAAKRTGYPADIGSAQLAWLFRVKQIAGALRVGPYSARALRDALPALRSLLRDPDAIARVPKILAECGVRFVIVEPVPGSKIDGVCFWLPKPNGGPVIGMSLRMDRIDNFWFVLRHEIEHVLNEDGKDVAVIDQDVLATPQEAHPLEELRADTAAMDFCVPHAEMSDFVIRNRPIFGEHRVLNFSERMNVHPGLVVGQLQRRTGNYKLFRKHLVHVRPIITAVAVTDGYGHIVQL